MCYSDRGCQTIQFSQKLLNISAINRPPLIMCSESLKFIGVQGDSKEKYYNHTSCKIIKRPPDLHVGFKYIIRQHRTPDFRILYLHHPQWLCSKEDLWWLRALPNNNNNNNSAPRKLRGPLIWRVRSSLAASAAAQDALLQRQRSEAAETEVRSHDTITELCTFS